MKRCFKCGAEKPLTEFYRHPAMADRHLGKCKECTKADARRQRERPAVQAYDRKRSKLPHRAALRRRVQRSWCAKHPERRQAQVRAGNAVRDGKLTPPQRCARCDRQRRVEKHHPDYNQPLVIEWLCKGCHVIADRERRQREGEAPR